MRLRRSSPWPALAALAWLGCDPNPGVVARTPHGGQVVPLPGKSGSVEFVRKDVDGQPGQSRFLAYFFGPDGGAMAPAPASATFKPEGKGARPVDFKPGQEGESTLLSDPFPSEGGEIEGEFAATLGGQPVKMPIRVR